VPTADESTEICATLAAQVSEPRVTPSTYRPPRRTERIPATPSAATPVVTTRTQRAMVSRLGCTTALRCMLVIRQLLAEAGSLQMSLLHEVALH